MVLNIRNLNDILDNEAEAFSRLLIKLLDNTNYLVIVVVMMDDKSLHMPEKYSDVIHIEKLPKQYSTKLLK